MSITESHIKKALDGTFCKYQPCLDVFKRVSVPVDYLPSHENTALIKSAKAITGWWADPNRRTRNKKRIPTPEQADMVRKYRDLGLSKTKIYQTMQAQGHKISQSGILSVLEGATA